MSGDTLVEALADLKEEEVVRIVKEMLAAGENPLKILDLCRDAMAIVGERFENSEYFLPDLIMAGEILSQISMIVKPKITEAGEEKYFGKVVIGTVQGDIHDIGKNVVIFMLEANGFEVHDLGVDVPAERFVEKIREVQPEVVGLSGLLTIAFDSMQRTIETIIAAGLRDTVKIMIGGSQVDERIREYTGADGYAPDAMAAVSLVKKWVGGK